MCVKVCQLVVLACLLLPVLCVAPRGENTVQSQMPGLSDLVGQLVVAKPIHFQAPCAISVAVISQLRVFRRSDSKEKHIVEHRSAVLL
jgi:hypothetical protein